MNFFTVERLLGERAHTNCFWVRAWWVSDSAHDEKRDVRRGLENTRCGGGEQVERFV
jgi:hypothetical protein